MRKLSFSFLLLTTPLLAAKPAPNPADYPLTIPVVCSFVTTQSSNTVVHLGVTLNGKPTELTTLVGFLPLIPGIYKARLLKDSSPNTYEVQQNYELLLPDGKLRTFYLAGIGQAVCNASAK